MVEQGGFWPHWKPGKLGVRHGIQIKLTKKESTFLKKLENKLLVEY